VKLSSREEITCPSCGSSFQLESGSTTGWERKAGQKLGRFELLDVVGQGAFGTVYKARDPELDRVVALKAPRPGNLAGPQELDRFLREARSAAQLRHSSIISVHEVAQVAGQLLDREGVEALVVVEGVDEVVVVEVDGAEVVGVVAVGVAVAHEVEPEQRHALAVMGRSQQAIDRLLVGVGAGARDEGVDLFRRRRQAEQVEAEPAQERAAVGLRGGASLPGGGARRGSDRWR
jgi:hypothetical protein